HTRFSRDWSSDVCSSDLGFDNFVKAVTDQRLAGPLVYVTLWTFAFALLTVALTFAIGLFLAITFNHPRMRGRRIYRALLILPYRSEERRVGKECGAGIVE